MIGESTVRWVRIRTKILLLAFRVRRHTRLMRDFTAKLEEHMAKFPKQAHTAEGKFLLERLRYMQKQEAQVLAAAQDEARRLMVR